MCKAAFAWRSHPLYPFILLLNRDEYSSRPTKPAEWWEDGEIVGGRDEKAGGAWLACSRSGRVSFVTNVREVRGVVGARSRGDLPVRFLQSKKTALEYAQEVAEEADLYGGFSLVLVDFCTSTMLYVTNRQGEDKPSIKQVSPGIHVLTNATMDSPWPKVQLKKQACFLAFIHLV